MERGIFNLEINVSSGFSDFTEKFRSLKTFYVPIHEILVLHAKAGKIQSTGLYFLTLLEPIEFFIKLHTTKIDVHCI